MEAEPFPHQKAVHDYAERHGLDYVWEGTLAFGKRQRKLPPDEFQIVAVHTRKGITKVLLFSKQISMAETLALDTPVWTMRKARLEAMRKGRLERLKARLAHGEISKNGDRH